MKNLKNAIEYKKKHTERSWQALAYLHYQREERVIKQKGKDEEVYTPEFERLKILRVGVLDSGEYEKDPQILSFPPYQGQIRMNLLSQVFWKL